jgi:hypothetical protein
LEHGLRSGQALPARLAHWRLISTGKVLLVLFAGNRVRFPFAWK